MSSDDPWRPEVWVWFLAVEAADLWPSDWPLEKCEERGEPQERKKPTSNLAPLINLLRSDAPLPGEARQLLADLLERHQLRLRAGGRKVPAYRTSMAEARLESAVEYYNELRDSDPKTHPDIHVNEAAAKWEVEPDTLDNRLKGRRGSSRRRS